MGGTFVYFSFYLQFKKPIPVLKKGEIPRDNYYKLNLSKGSSRRLSYFPVARTHQLLGVVKKKANLET